MPYKIISYSVPYIFGLLGIAWLNDPTYPLWGSIALIIVMGMATILHIAILVKKLRRKNAKEQQ